MAEVIDKCILPLVSVRIPAYNHEKFVKKTLDSIADQDYPNIEIVIIDDASTDQTWREIQSWIEERGGAIDVRAVRHTKNQGISRTINELIPLCQGEYLVGIASDDYLLDGSISMRVAYLQANPEKMMVFADCIVVDNGGAITHLSGLSELYGMKKERLLDDRTIAQELIVNWGVPGGTLMVRKEIHNDLMFNDKLLVEDFDFYLKALSKGRLGFLDNKISAYRLHGENVSRRADLSLRRRIDFIRTMANNFFSFPFYLWPCFVKFILLRIFR